MAIFCAHLLPTFHLRCMCPCGLLYMYIMGTTFLLSIYCTYLGYCMNVACTWWCSIHFTTLLLAYCMYISCITCACYVLHVASTPTIYVLCVHVWGVCVHVLASDSSAQASHVQVAIQTLDENDNAPQLAEPYDTFVCDSAAPGQVSR